MKVETFCVFVSYVLLFALSLVCSDPVVIPDSCESNIFCRGQLLEDVQLSKIYTDSKTFVDKKLKYSESNITSKYEELLKASNNATPPRDVLQKFVDDNFEDGDELEVWSPSDWVERPAILERIKDENLKDWAFQLNGIWKNLSRRVHTDVEKNPTQYSLIYVPNGFVIPGGRFRELYYWDTFWIVRGLLICQMHETAKGVIENLLHLINTVGHMPNGNRVYYLQRTQPPLLAQMVDTYLTHTNDFSFIKKNIHLLDKEMDYFLNSRLVNVDKDGKTYKLFRYYAVSEGPRPESYREDLQTSESVKEEDRTNLFIDLKSAAESGWDFSTRWFITNATNAGNISNIHTRYIIPVDLNAMMHKNFLLLTKWYTTMGNVKKVKKYETLAKDIINGIEEVLWNEEEGIWFDYDILNGVPRKYFYMSNFAPLWTRSYTFTPSKATDIAANYIRKSDLSKFVGGSPTSLIFSGEQWDYPNAWPPLQAFMIQGLDRIGTPEASDLAFQYARVYTKSNYVGFKDLGVMFEKYDSLIVGRTGSGGEYDAQSGFGWTNGFAFELLDRWGEKLTSNSQK